MINTCRNITSPRRCSAWNSIWLTAVLWVSSLVILVGNTVAYGAENIVPAGPRIFFYIDREPAYDVSEIEDVYDSRLVPLWLQAINRNERELLCKSAEAFVIAKKLGNPDVNEEVAAKLLEAFEKTEDAISKRSLGIALSELNYSKAANAFEEAFTEKDYQLCTVLEPALGTWKHPSTITRNLERLNNKETLVPWKKLAIQVLMNARDENAKSQLIEIVTNKRERIDLRLAAANALGVTFSAGLLKVADELNLRSSEDDSFSQLLAIEVIRQHSSKPAVQLVKRLAISTQTTVQSKALEQLQRINPQFVADFTLDEETKNRFAVTHPNSNVRRLVIESCFQITSLKTVSTIASFLDDPHPENRQLAADALYALAQEDDAYKLAVVEQVQAGLQHSSWRVLERSLVLAAFLKMESSHEQVIALLQFERTEVGAAAAFALKMLNLKSTLPATLSQLIENINVKFQLNEDLEIHDYEFRCLQTQHLCEFMGRQRFPQADASLRKFIPKSQESGKIIQSPRSRGIAIWAIGRLHEDEGDQELAVLLRDRLTDLSTPLPEFDEARLGCAYALGWIGDNSIVSDLEQYSGRGAPDRIVSTACAWAVEHLTGKTTPLLSPIKKLRNYNWFLRPSTEFQIAPISAPSDVRE